MRTAVAICFVGVLLSLGPLAMAQVPTSGNVFFGYSYYRTNLFADNTLNTNGWEAKLECKIFPFIGIVGDFSQHYGSENFPIAIPVGDFAPTTANVGIHEQNYLFGPRVSVSVGKFRPFAEALFGASHVNAGSVGSDTSFATALGGGLDYRIFRPIAWRFQGDYVQTHFFGNTQNNVRLSTGIV